MIRSLITPRSTAMVMLLKHRSQMLPLFILQRKKQPCWLCGKSHRTSYQQREKADLKSRNAVPHSFWGCYIRISHVNSAQKNVWLDSLIVNFKQCFRYVWEVFIRRCLHCSFPTIQDRQPLNPSKQTNLSNLTMKTNILHLNQETKSRSSISPFFQSVHWL